MKRRKARQAEAKPRKLREGRVILVSWQGRYYLLTKTEADLAAVWLAARGHTLAALPYGREVRCLAFVLDKEPAYDPPPK